MKRKLYILVYNMKCQISPIRHIVEDTSVPFKLKEFKKAYYNTYNKLDGDKFLIFKTMEKANAKCKELEDIYYRKALKK